VESKVPNVMGATHLTNSLRRAKWKLYDPVSHWSRNITQWCFIGLSVFFHYGMNFRIFEVMSAYNIGYQLIILQHWVQINYFKTLDTN